jgi:hypothetical protein
MSNELYTWAEHSRFRYDGSVSEGTKIFYGRNFARSVVITAGEYKKMLEEFSGREIPPAITREEEKRGQESLGKWFADNKMRVSIASYVAPVLIHEGYCVREGAKIRFLPQSARSS